VIRLLLLNKLVSVVLHHISLPNFFLYPNPIQLTTKCNEIFAQQRSLMHNYYVLKLWCNFIYYVLIKIIYNIILPICIHLK